MTLAGVPHVQHSVNCVRPVVTGGDVRRRAAGPGETGPPRPPDPLSHSNPPHVCSARIAISQVCAFRCDRGDLTRRAAGPGKTAFEFVSVPSNWFTQKQLVATPQVVVVLL